MPIKKTTRNRIIAAGIALAAIAGFFLFKNGAETAPDAQIIPTVNQVNLSDYSSAAATVFGTGQIESENQVTIRSEVNVPVRTVLVSPGQEVTAGQVLVEFQNDDIQAQLAQAQASVNRAQASLALQENQTRPEDIAKAELGVQQAQQALNQAIAQRDQARLANENAVENAQDAVNDLYEDGITAARSNFSTLRDALVVVSDYQQEYFNCQDNQLCYEIARSKEQAMYLAFDIRNAGRFSSSIILGLETGIPARIAEIESATELNGTEIEAILEDIRMALIATRDSLDSVREGLDSTLAANATAADQTTVELERTGVEGAITSTETILQLFGTIQGGMVGGIPQSVEDARQAAEQALRIAEASVITAELNVRAAELTLQTLQNGPRDIDLAPARFAVQEAQAAYNLLASNLRKYIITAPFTGTIATVSANQGELLGAGQDIVSIVNEDALLVKAYLSAEDRKLISVHSTVTVDGTYDGVITYIAPSLDTQTGKVEVGIAILDTANRLTVGEFVQIEIRTDIDAGSDFLLPLTSVKNTPEGTFVFTVIDGKIARIPVTTGRIFGSSVEVSMPVQIDMIVSSVRGLSEGDEVTILE